MELPIILRVNDLVVNIHQNGYYYHSTVTRKNISIDEVLAQFTPDEIDDLLIKVMNHPSFDDLHLCSTDYKRMIKILQRRL